MIDAIATNTKITLAPIFIPPVIVVTKLKSNKPTKPQLIPPTIDRIKHILIHSDYGGLFEKHGYK